jgi:hypothetical protein
MNDQSWCQNQQIFTALSCKGETVDTHMWSFLIATVKRSCFCRSALQQTPNGLTFTAGGQVVSQVPTVDSLNSLGSFEKRKL